MSNFENLTKFLAVADVPESRKDLASFANISWLVGNLGVRNSKLDGYGVAYKELKALYKSALPR